MNHMSPYHNTIENVQRDRSVVLGNIDLERERYSYFQQDPNANTTYERQMVHHYHDDNELNQTFFSKQNIDALQDYIRYQVYQQSGDSKWVIGKQDETELLIVMRSVYLQHSRNLTQCDSIIPQIRELNRVVSNELVPKILSEIIQYMGYLRDASTLYAERALEHPVNVSSKGTKTYSFTNWF